ncbi:hypothetical protein PT281_06130 [Lactobacillus sp. ESL0701]|uniref:hypothetical protein n=1 Tax=Lactobacillus sp. ESL0701 TaxID=2983217 RepID=UPI0023F87D7E|nr:hypothetical protein [Lactobacillus sp. ESL0701]MDF7672847.1 hypothetical protein [Lactobacillus sp. ESL0701]
MLYYAALTVDYVTFELAANKNGLTYVRQKGLPTLPISHFYPSEKLSYEPAKLAPYLCELAEFLTGTRKGFDLPLSISQIVTPWQQKVLNQVK